MKTKITCLNKDCPDKRSLCCNAPCKMATELEIMLGVPLCFCSKCGKRWEGGKCQMEKRIKTEELTLQEQARIIQEHTTTIAWWVKRAEELEGKLKEAENYYIGYIHELEKRLAEMEAQRNDARYYLFQTKKTIKKAWIDFWKEKCVYTEVEPILGMEVEQPKYELKFWKDFEKFLDKELNQILEGGKK